MNDDERLVRDAARGDATALEALVRRYAPDVSRYMDAMLGDDRDAEDAMQETFVRIARGVARYEGEDAGTWIWTHARRVAYDHPRAVLEGIPPVADVVDRRWARQALRALAPELREALVLRELLGWDRERIAAVLGTDLASVKHGLSLARAAAFRQAPAGVTSAP